MGCLFKLGQYPSTGPPTYQIILCYIKDWATLLHFIYFIYLLLVTIYLITKLSITYILVLAEKTLLKTAYHFLLLLVGFDTLTYRKDYDRSPTLVGQQGLITLCKNLSLGALGDAMML